MYSAWGRPADLNIVFMATLSMPRLDPSTPEPTYGSPASSRSPWSVPSSPPWPCTSGKMTSIPTLAPAVSMGTSPPTEGSPVRAACVARAFSRSAPRSVCASPEVSQNPSRVMPIGTTSYFSWSRCAATARAEMRDTSCSTDRPPNTSPTRFRFTCSRLRMPRLPHDRRAPPSAPGYWPRAGSRGT